MTAKILRKNYRVQTEIPCDGLELSVIDINEYNSKTIHVIVKKLTSERNVQVEHVCKAVYLALEKANQIFLARTIVALKFTNCCDLSTADCAYIMSEAIHDHFIDYPSSFLQDVLIVCSNKNELNELITAMQQSYVSIRCSIDYMYCLVGSFPSVQHAVTELLDIFRDERNNGMNNNQMISSTNNNNNININDNNNDNINDHINDEINYSTNNNEMINGTSNYNSNNVHNIINDNNNGNNNDNINNKMHNRTNNDEMISGTSINNGNINGNINDSINDNTYENNNHNINKNTSDNNIDSINDNNNDNSNDISNENINDNISHIINSNFDHYINKNTEIIVNESIYGNITGNINSNICSNRNSDSDNNRNRNTDSNSSRNVSNIHNDYNYNNVRHQLSFTCKTTLLQLFEQDEATRCSINAELRQDYYESGYTAQWKVEDNKRIVVTTDSLEHCERVREVFATIICSYVKHFDEEPNIVLIRDIRETCLTNRQTMILDDSAKMQVKYSEQYNSLIISVNEAVAIVTIDEDCKTVIYEGVRTHVYCGAHFMGLYLRDTATFRILLKFPLPIEKYLISDYGLESLLTLQSCFRKFSVQFRVINKNNSERLEVTGKKLAIDVIVPRLMAGNIIGNDEKLEVQYFRSNDETVREYLLSDEGRQYVNDIEQHERVIIHRVESIINIKNKKSTKAFRVHFKNAKVCAICCDINSLCTDTTIYVSNLQMNEQLRKVIERREGNTYITPLCML